MWESNIKCGLISCGDWDTDCELEELEEEETIAEVLDCRKNWGET